MTLHVLCVVWPLSLNAKSEYRCSSLPPSLQFNLRQHFVPLLREQASLEILSPTHFSAHQEKASPSKSKSSSPSQRSKVTVSKGSSLAGSERTQQRGNSVVRAHHHSSCAALPFTGANTKARTRGRGRGWGHCRGKTSDCVSHHCGDEPRGEWIIIGGAGVH